MTNFFLKFGLNILIIEISPCLLAINIVTQITLLFFGLTFFRYIEQFMFDFMFNIINSETSFN